MSVDACTTAGVPVELVEEHPANTAPGNTAMAMTDFRIMNPPLFEIAAKTRIPEPCCSG